jgi:hypothetical protein
VTAPPPAPEAPPPAAPSEPAPSKPAARASSNATATAGAAGSAVASQQAAKEAAAREAIAHQQTLNEHQRGVNEQQRGVNEQQAATNAHLQQEVEKLKPVEVTIPAGTRIAVRPSRDLSTEDLATGSTFEALLDNDVAIDGHLLAKAGSRVTGVVVNADKGGKVKGTASLEVGVRSIVGAKSRVVAVHTDTFVANAQSTKKKDATRTGIATGIGAAVGAIAGGGKGAAIGAGVGAAAGVGTNMATKGAAAVIPAETLIELKLTAPVTVSIQK